MQSKRNLLWIVAITLVTAAVILAGWEDIWVALKNVTPGIMVLLIVLQFLTLSTLAGQWQYLLKKRNCHLSLGHVLAVTLAGNYIESVTPSVKLGGEAAKVYLFKRYSNLDYELLTGILLALKFFSLLPFVLLSTLSVTLAILHYSFPGSGLYALVIPAAFFAVIAALYYKKDVKSGVATANQEIGEKSPGIDKKRMPLFGKGFTGKLSTLNLNYDDVL